MIRIKLNNKAALVILAAVMIVVSGGFVRAWAAGVDDGDLSAIRYDKWHTQRMYTMVPAQSIVAKFLKTFKEYPPAQKPGSFSVGDALEQLQTASQGKFIESSGCSLTGASTL
jgi:hypothetical protein